MKTRKPTDPITKAAKDVRDATREALHRSAADAEHSKRDLAGDAMTTEEKVTSIASEGKERVQAAVDKGKRKARDHE
ncbi:MAG: hypothetical protein JO302_04590 [Candidatus Eremiobacteraeota bacterium]|nr:hypothetical protein [Candidatus Eremiobacteraeota bacterium]